jgi:ribosomal protein L37AE/L43A
MDTVIVSASFMCNLEVKNIAGTLFFDEANDQMIRTFDGKEEGFPNSLIQIRRQQKHLQNWLADHHFPCLPCYSFVIISNSSTIIKSTKSLKTHVIHSATIPFKFYLLENNNKEQILTKSSLKKLSKTLLKEHREDDCNILEQFNITREDMITGVQCQSCGYIPMNRSNGFWRCSSCKHKSKDAHIQTLDDYKYLFGKEISNQQLRSFLQISSRTSAAKLLRKLTYCHEGTTKNRVYFIPFLTGSKTPTPRLERN